MNAGNLVMSGVLILAGLIALASPQHVIGWKRRSFARRRVDRWRRGTDAYLRKLASWMPTRPRPIHTAYGWRVRRY